MWNEKKSESANQLIEVGADFPWSKFNLIIYNLIV
jgi:hypothetical protein